MASIRRPRVFLDISIGAEPAGRLTIELFTDKTHKTCENFRQLCTGEHNGLSYAKAPLHRVIEDFMIQGGDIANGDGTGTASIYDGAFDDENLEWRDMDAAGLVCSATRGKDMNNSQFFITLDACPHLNGKQTIFGTLVSGQDVLQRISKVAVDGGDCPVQPVLISRCGELEKKQKSTPSHDNATSANSSDRGRRRKSGEDEMDGDTPPPQGRRTRRRSDNVVDEGLRGRPRMRSGSRTPSQSVIEEDEGTSDSHSPVKKHKRKRSPSPSRRVDGASKKDGYERRRRSLPNQYDDRRQQGNDRYRPNPRGFDQQNTNRRRDERYRPNDGRLENDGRLGGTHDDIEPPVKFKGRGIMKYREPDRAW